MDSFHQLVQIFLGLLALFFVFSQARAEYHRRRGGPVLMDLGRPVINKWRKLVLILCLVPLVFLMGISLIGPHGMGLIEIEYHGVNHTTSLLILPVIVFSVYLHFRKGEVRELGVVLPQDPHLTRWDQITSYMWMDDGFQLALQSPNTSFSFFRTTVKMWFCSQEERGRIEDVLAQHTTAMRLDEINGT
jgi:hypothetical protein